MNEKVNKPPIRFTGYTNAWEQRKLGELGICQSGVGFPSSEQGGKVGVPFYKVSDMNNAGNDRNMTSANNYVTSEQVHRIGWNPITDVPAIIFAKVGAAIMLNRKRLCIEPFLLDNNMMSYRINPVSDTEFIRTLFEKIDLTSLVQIGALPSYNATDVENLSIQISTNKNEQQKIGSFFHNISSHIIFYRRKYDKLVNMKKAMLEKMFPQHGKDAPEIRFTGFAGVWERRKVGDIVAEIERPITMKDEGVYQLVTVKRRNEGVVSRGFFKGKDILVKNYFMIHEGDYLISKRQVIHGANGYVPKELNHAVVSNEYMVAVSNEFVSSKFWSLMSKRREMYRMFLLSSYGVDIEKMVFNVGDWKKRFVIVPSMPEQNRIISFFEHLDNLIALHQHKSEKLQNIKKSCLEKMFV